MKLTARLRISLLVLLLSGCSIPPLGQPTSSLAPSASPVSTATAAEAATVAPTFDPTRRPPPATDTLPPRGILRAESGPIEGWLGSYCWQGTCADVAVVPPKDQLPEFTTEGEDLEFSLSHNATFVRWQATYGGSVDGERMTLGQGGEGFDPDARPSPALELLSSATFASPPAGDWVVFVQVFFDGGDLSYAWHVVVN